MHREMSPGAANRKKQMSAFSLTHAIKSRSMFRSLGGKVAAGYLRNRGYSLEVALQLLGIKAR